MEALQNGAQELIWLSGELEREVETLVDTQLPHIHTFLTINLLHAIEKQVGGMRQTLTLGKQSEQKEKVS